MQKFTILSLGLLMASGLINGAQESEWERLKRSGDLLEILNFENALVKEKADELAADPQFEANTDLVLELSFDRSCDRSIRLGRISKFIFQKKA